MFCGFLLSQTYESFELSIFYPFGVAPFKEE